MEILYKETLDVKEIPASIQEVKRILNDFESYVDHSTNLAIRK